MICSYRNELCICGNVITHINYVCPVNCIIWFAEGEEDEDAEDEQNEDELDKQMGDLGDEDANKLDEQMWGSDEEEEQQQNNDVSLVLC